MKPLEGPRVAISISSNILRGLTYSLYLCHNLAQLTDQLYQMKIFILSLLLVFIYSCNTDNVSSDIITECKESDSLNYPGESDLSKWEYEVISSDTSDIISYFDTLLFDTYGVINTISYTVFKDPISNDFSTTEYIQREYDILNSTFSSTEYGEIPNSKFKTFYFHFQDSTRHSYMEYSFKKTLNIVLISTSAKPNNLPQELCYLRRITRQLKLNNSKKYS